MTRGWESTSTCPLGCPLSPGGAYHLEGPLTHGPIQQRVPAVIPASSLQILSLRTWVGTVTSLKNSSWQRWNNTAAPVVEKLVSCKKHGSEGFLWRIYFTLTTGSHRTVPTPVRKKKNKNKKHTRTVLNQDLFWVDQETLSPFISFRGGCIWRKVSVMAGPHASLVLGASSGSLGKSSLLSFWICNWLGHFAVKGVRQWGEVVFSLQASLWPWASWRRCHEKPPLTWSEAQEIGTSHQIQWVSVGGEGFCPTCPRNKNPVLSYFSCKYF